MVSAAVPTPPKSRTFGPAAVGLAAAAAAAVMTAILAAFGVTPGDSLKFAAGLAILAGLPGGALFPFFRLSRSRLESMVMALALGMGTATIAHKFARLAHAEWLFGLALAIAAAAVAARTRKRPVRRSDFEIRKTPAIAGLAVLFVLIVGILAVDNYRNGRMQPDGSIRVNIHYYDGFIRIPVTRELTHSVPPQMPFAAGIPLAYHYGLDLFTQMFIRYFGLNVFDLNHRLVLTFLFMLAAIAAFAFFRRLFRSEASAWLGTFFVLFGSGGLTWAAALIFGVPFGGNPFFAFYLFDTLGVNSFLPALTLIFCGGLALLRGLEERRPGGLVLAGLFFALAMEFKVFLFGPILGALIVTGILTRLRFRDGRLLAAAAATASFAAPLALADLVTNAGGLHYVFQVRAIEWPARMLDTLRLDVLSAAWAGLFHGHPTPGRAVAALAAAALFFLGGFGWSSWALPGLLRDFFAFRRDRLVRFFLAGVFGAALLNFFFVHWALGGQSRDILNIYVYYLGLAVLLAFAADAAVRVLRRFARPWRAAAAAGLVLLAAVNSAWFITAKIRFPDPRVFSAEFVAMARWLTDSTPPQSVILQPNNLPYVPYLSDRRVVLDDSMNSYIPFHLTREQISIRRDAVNRFFGDPQAYPNVLTRFGVTHVVTYNEGKFFRLAGAHLILPGFALERIFTNGGFTVYRVERR